MKRIKIFLTAVCILWFASAVGFSEGFFTHSDEIVFSETCPEGFQPIGDTLFLGEGEIRVIASRAKYFASGNHDIVSIDENGVMHAVSSGKTEISVYLADNLRKDFAVEVKNAPKSIKLTDKKGTLIIGKTHQLEATLTKSTASTISWSSSAPDIVNVDETGFLTALSEGSCTITARTHNGLTAECTVTVTFPPPAEIDLFTDEITLSIGESISVLYTLVGGYQETVEWLSDNPGIATVDQNGTVTAVSIGKTAVCMKASGGDIRFVDIIVTEGATQVTFPTSEFTMYVGGRTRVEPTITGGSGKYEYVSLDNSIATIDPETGEICAVRSGQVYILGVTPNFAFGEFLLTIVEGPQALILTPDKTEIAVGASVRTSNNLDRFERQFTWYESSDAEIAHVDEYGVVTGMGEGTAVISVHSGGLIGETEITVLPKAEHITARAERNPLGAGDSCAVLYELDKGTDEIVFSSSDMYVAQVDGSTGVVYALSPGTCEITLSLSNGASASFPIDVFPAPESVYIEKSRYTFAAGNRHRFAFGVNEGAVTQYSVSSSDPEMVWYEDGVLVCGQKTGSASVAVQTHNGYSAKAEITVIGAPEEIRVQAEKLSYNPDFDYYLFLSQGASHPLCASVDSVPDIEIRYSASHPDVADVSESGVVVAHKRGTSLVTVSLFSGLKARVLVCVQ